VAEGKVGKGPLGSIAGVALAMVVAALVVVAFLYVRAPRATRVQVGAVAPDFDLPAVNGGSPTRLSKARGGPTFLFLLDTRRDGNEAYVDSLQRMHKRYAERGLTTIAVALDPDVTTVRQFITRLYMEFPILSDPFASSLVKAGYGSPHDPEAYLLDGQGRVQAVFTERVDWNTTEFRDKVEKILSPASPAP
jgi:peroxiredoxin